MIWPFSKKEICVVCQEPIKNGEKTSPLVGVNEDEEEILLGKICFSCANILDEKQKFIESSDNNYIEEKISEIEKNYKD